MNSQNRADRRLQYIEFGASAWSFSGKGAYTGRLDRRQLYNICHEWVPSNTGDFGQIETQALIPADWKPPFALHFYAADDYASEPDPNPPHDWWGIESYVGHRFKQILVNGRVAWEADVADHVVSPAFAADITPYVTPGVPFTLALRVLDKAGTEQVLPEDFLRIGTTEGGKKVEDPRRFYTNVWWGDVALRERDSARVPLNPRQMPACRAVRVLPQSAFPLPPLDGPWQGEIVLPLDSDDLPDCGFPVTCGIPLHIGKARKPSELSVRDSHGDRVPCQFTVMNRWPDGTIRFALADLIAKPGCHPYTLMVGEKPVRPAHRARVSRKDGSTRLETGAITIDFGTDSLVLVDAIALAGESKPAFEKLTAAVSAGGRVFRAVRDRVTVVSRGPVRAELEIAGSLVDGAESIGRFTFRIAEYSGLPLIRTFFRTFNDTGGTIAIDQISLRAETPLTGSIKAAWTDSDGRLDADVTDSFQLAQPGTGEWKAAGVAGELRPGERASGWFSFSGGSGSVQIGIRKFWQQYPKSVGLSKGTVCIGLCSAEHGAPSFQQTSGEARRHEVWLHFGNGPVLEKPMLRPPRLFSAGYFAATGALGPCVARTEGRFQEFSDFIRTAYNGVPPDETGYGIRDFGDRRFRNEEHMWCNNYYDHMLETLAECRMTGGRHWFDRAEETACHVMDVDQVHYDAGAGTAGAIYSYDAHSHTQGGFWDAMLRQGAAFDLYYRMTGDPDAKRAMLDLADFILRNGRGARPGESARDYAGLMMTCIHAYDETGRKQYLRHCRRILKAVLDQGPRGRAATFVDARRGTFVEIHGNFNYYGNVPWMVAQFAEPLYMYWRITGDPDAARALAGFAESIICEDMEPDEPGNFTGYSHNPKSGPSSTYNMLIAPVMMYAHELTGDEYFGKCAAAAYRLAIRTLREKPRTIIFWTVPALLYFLDKNRECTKV